MKKIITLLLSGALISSIGSNCVFAAKKFTDFSEKDYSWAYEQVMEMVSKGYITGYDDNTFKPDNSVTRLEVLALFSRALGALEEENAEILENAVAKYKESILPYNLPWGTDEIAFLMYRNILTVDDLTTYLEGTLKNEAMPRHEAAVIITKAMGGEKEAKGSQSVTLDFTDYKEIPSGALQYIKYVSDKNIMTGMEDGSFSPNTSVLRSQMGVMLSRVVDKMDYSIVTGKIISVDVDARLLVLKDEDGEEMKYTYLNNVFMMVEGEETAPKYMTVGVPAIVTLSAGRVAFVDALSSIPDETLTGIFQSRTTSASTKITKVSIKDPETNEIKSYECSETLSVIYNGSPSTLTNFKLNDQITVELSNGKIEKIIGETKEKVIQNAVIEDISTDPDFTLTISHASEEYDGQTYEISDNVSVNKNNAITDFSSIYVGDKVNLTIVYGVVTGVKAISSKSTVEGTIKSVLISADPSIVVNVKGEDKEYAVSKDIQVLINGEEGTMYDFRVGDIVKISLESQTVTKISTTSAQSTSGKITGVITAVNNAIGFIKVSYKNDDEYTVEETVYCKDSSTKILNESGQTKSMKDLKEGQHVTIHGTSKNGAFTANIVIYGEN